MTTLVLSVIGDDRAGLVHALADIVAAHDGNWTDSRLAELAGKFAGIVVVEVPAAQVEAFRAGLAPLQGLLEVAVHPAAQGPTGTSGGTAATGGPAGPSADDRTVTLEVLGQDRPGIVRAVSEVFARHGVNVAELTTGTREAPMAGGRLFEARADLIVPAAVDVERLRADLEALADEVVVDITLVDR